MRADVVEGALLLGGIALLRDLAWLGLESGSVLRVRVRLSAQCSGLGLGSVLSAQGQ